MKGEPEWFLALAVIFLGFLVLTAFIFSGSRTPVQIGIVALVFLIIPWEITKKFVVGRITVREVVSLVESGKPVECRGELVENPTLQKVDGKIYVRTGDGQLVSAPECRKPRTSAGR